jgi:hypothetical protein
MLVSSIAAVSGIVIWVRLMEGKLMVEEVSETVELVMEISDVSQYCQTFIGISNGDFGDNLADVSIDQVKLNTFFFVTRKQ